MQFKYKTMLLKGLKTLVFYALPYLIARAMEFYPELMGLSVGTALVMLANWLKVKVGLRLP